MGEGGSVNITDRELLELAAKAAGIEYGTDRLAQDLALYRMSGGHFWLPRWNPLTDDGDALRLAVKLRMLVEIERVLELSSANGQYESHDEDPYAATRRAIVRAAAEIGRAMP